MAVTLTIAQLSAAVRLGDSAEELTEITRLHAYATEAVEQYAPEAPETTANEAVVRLAAQMFDQPTATRGAYSNALRNSGAARILMPYRIHRAGSTQDAIAVAQGAVGTTGNPVINVAVSGDLLTVTFADGNTEDYPIVAGGGTPADTADLLVERLGTLDNPTLPDDRAWLGTGVFIPDGIHVLLIDAGQASDDYHLVDWDAILTHIDVTVGAISMAGEFETFQGDAFTYLRIGHSVDNEILIANDSTGSINLSHVHIERLLAPTAVGGGSGIDQDARDSADTAQTAAEAAQTEIDDHETNHPSGGTTDQTARDAAEANATALADKMERSDVSAGVGISVLADTGSTTGLTISITGSSEGPEELSGGQWRFDYNTQPPEGRVFYNGNITPLEWVFATGGAFNSAQDELLALTAHDEIEIKQSATRFQLITLTIAPTLSGNNVTVTGTTPPRLNHERPENNAAVTVTLIPGPIQGVDQVARDAAGEAEATADAAQTDITDHEANHPSGNALTAAAIQALGAGATNSNTEIPSAHSGDLGKISVANLHAYMESSVGLGPRINPTPSIGTAGYVSVVNEDGDGYTNEGIGRVPLPVNGQIIIGAGPIWTTTRLPTRSDTFPHVSRIPVATETSSEVLYLDHEYYEGGIRTDVTLRIATDGNLSGYIDPRLGFTLGSINAQTPVVRIQVLIAADGTTIERWNTIEFFEEATANEFNFVFLNNGQYTLGVPFAQSGLWKRRFLTEPAGFQIDTDILFNLRRTLDGSNFHTDGTGVRFNPGLWQKYLVRDGVFAYDHLSGPRIQHSDGVGEPLNQPTRNGEFYVDNLAQTWVGLVDRHLLTTDSAVSTSILQFDQYVLEADTLADLLNGVGVAGFTWIPSVGNRDLIQALSATPGDVDEHRNWFDTWTLVAAQHPQQTSPNEYADAIANRDALWLGGFHDPESAADEASHIISQADYDAGRRIFYGHAGGGTQGIYRFTAYTQGTVTVRTDGHWIGPFATIADIETIANDILDDAVESVADEAAAFTHGDLMGVLYLWQGGIRYNGNTYLSGGGASWHFAAHISGGAWVANTARAVTWRTFPIGPYADYAAILAAILDGTITQIAVRISQSDPGGADEDHGTTVLPNVSGFNDQPGWWRVFPGYALNVNPVGFTVTFAAAGLTITSDAALVAVPGVSVRIGVWS